MSSLFEPGRAMAWLAWSSGICEASATASGRTHGHDSAQRPSHSASHAMCATTLIAAQSSSDFIKESSPETVTRDSSSKSIGRFLPAVPLNLAAHQQVLSTFSKGITLEHQHQHTPTTSRLRAQPLSQGAEKQKLTMTCQRSPPRWSPLQFRIQSSCSCPLLRTQVLKNLSRHVGQLRRWSRNCNLAKRGFHLRVAKTQTN